MLGHRLRRRPNIKPALGQRLVFAVNLVMGQTDCCDWRRLEQEVNVDHLRVSLIMTHNLVQPLYCLSRVYSAGIVKSRLQSSDSVNQIKSNPALKG